MIHIVDYRMGNLGSIRNMLKYAGVASTITSDPQEVSEAEQLILPGVGAFDHGMEHIESLGLLEALNHAVLVRKAPILGICLGMQLLTESSEEGQRPGLGWIPAQTIRFRFDGPEFESLRVPHMGWNVARPTDQRSVFAEMDPEAAFYFVHSYHAVCDDPANVLAWAHHGYDFCCAVHKDNIFGVQFHPEKSHRFGWTLLRQFARCKE
jgi:imidazole glycerol-phosphate synthase subunit HisH